MKKSFLIILSMAVCLMLLTGYAFAESTDRDPGLSRGNLTLGYDTAQHLAERHAAHLVSSCRWKAVECLSSHP